MEVKELHSQGDQQDFNNRKQIYWQKFLEHI